MNKTVFKRITCKLALLAVFASPELASAQYFSWSQTDSEVLLGFRKSGNYVNNPYDLVVNFGSVTNLLKLSPGMTINITNFSASQLADAFSSTYAGVTNLQWSAFATFYNAGTWNSTFGTYPASTIWYTLPSTSISTQTAPQSRLGVSQQEDTGTAMLGVGTGAVQISGPGYVGSTGTDNNPDLVREPTTYASDLLATYIADAGNATNGDFGGLNSPLPFMVENTTPNGFASAQRSDFYQSCPATGPGPYSSRNPVNTDPITGQTNGLAYWVGYFLLNPNGSMTFTRAFSFSGTATNGTAPLKVVFSSTATNTSGATNWVWNFGNGISVTNSTDASVTNTYAASGTYTVTLTINGPNGSSVLTLANYVVVTSAYTPTPAFSSAVLSGGKLVLNGTNGSSGVQFRILMSTNVSSSAVNWQGVYTNNFLSNGNFSYTNSSPTNLAGFFRVVTP